MIKVKHSVDDCESHWKYIYLHEASLHIMTEELSNTLRYKEQLSNYFRKLLLFFDYGKIWF